VGVGVEVVSGTFRPWLAGYRFGGTVHPNAQGIYCVILCLAATCKLADAKQRRGLIWACLLGGLTLLCLTKSRAALAGLVAAWMAIWFLRTSAATKVRLAGFGVTACATLVLTTMMFGMDLKDRTVDAFLMGRGGDTDSLSGRIPLWNELLHYVDERPMAGYGFNSFWDAAHIEDVSEVAEWSINSAHSGYLDTVLGVGLIGGAILIACTLVVAGYAAIRCLARGDSGDLFLFGLLVFAVINGAMESSFAQPGFAPFLATCGIGRIALSREEIDET